LLGKMNVIILLTVYLIGCILFTWWMDRWDCAYRPMHPNDPMPIKGMIGGFGLVVASFAWIFWMLWLIGEIAYKLFA